MSIKQSSFAGIQVDDLAVFAKVAGGAALFGAVAYGFYTLGYHFAPGKMMPVGIVPVVAILVLMLILAFRDAGDTATHARRQWTAVGLMGLCVAFVLFAAGGEDANPRPQAAVEHCA